MARFPGPRAVWAVASVTPIQPTETGSEAADDLDGIVPLGAADTTAWNLCTPASAEYPTAHCVPCEQDPTSVPVVVSKIWSAPPWRSAAADALAVSTTLPPETAAAALEASVTVDGGVVGRMVETGTLGRTDGLPAGAPSSVDWATRSLQAAGVLSAEPLGHGAWPSGVEAVPGATVAPRLVRHDAPTPDAGQGSDPSGRLSCRGSGASAEQTLALAAHRVAVDA
jgi:hypothetical protein